MRKFRSFTLQLIAGANIASVIAMTAVGYSDHLDPIAFPLLSIVGLAFPAFLLLNIVFLVFWVVVKPRYVLIPLAGFIICFHPVRNYCPLNPFTTTKGADLKVVSFNVWMFSAEYPDSTLALLHYLQKQHADIICLQEADVSGSPEKVVDSVMNRLYSHRDTTSYSNGDVIRLYSRYPIIRREAIPYPSLSNHSSAFFLKMGSDTVIVVANHLQSIGLSREDKLQFKYLVKQDLGSDSARAVSHMLYEKISEASMQRAPQAEAVATFIRKHKHYPMIVCGDFNDGPISYARRTIAEGLTDCYRESGNGPGITYHRGGFYVRIDNIFCSEHFTPLKCVVGNTIKASDHYPIIAWLKKKKLNQ
ncbi:MAG: endonuclease/exonuclease/phosphatase family protein [Prevotella sp.]|nr:endonuclease/exonuclease/phosphatase family protein [Prevotella sp.]